MHVSNKKWVIILTNDNKNNNQVVKKTDKNTVKAKKPTDKPAGQGFKSDKPKTSNRPFGNKPQVHSMTYH